MKLYAVPLLCVLMLAPMVALAGKAYVVYGDWNACYPLVQKDFKEFSAPVSRHVFRSLFQSQIVPQYQIGVKDKKWYWVKQWPEGDDPSQERSLDFFNYPYGKPELRPPTEAEAWTRYQNGGRFLLRDGINKKMITCPACEGSGRVREAIKDSLRRPSGSRRMQGDDGMKSVVCKQCNGKKRVSVPTAYEYRVLCRPEKESDRAKERENLETFLGAPLGKEISPHRVSWIFKQQPDYAVLMDYLPEQDFLKFCRYFVVVVPDTLMVHSVIAYTKASLDAQKETFNTVLGSIRAAYGETCTETSEDFGRTVRFTCKANPNRQILVYSTTVHAPTTTYVQIFIQATDCDLQQQAHAKAVKPSTQLKAKDVRDAVDVL